MSIDDEGAPDLSNPTPHLPDLTALANLQAETEALGRQFTTASEHEEATGYDSTELVSVTVNASGTVQTVDVDSSWRRTIDPRAFDSAVLDAVNKAALQLLHARAEAQETPQHNRSADTADDHRAEHEGLAGYSQTPSSASLDEGPSSASAQDAFDHILKLLENVNSDLARYEETLQTNLSQSVSGTSSGGNVTVTMTGASRRD